MSIDARPFIGGERCVGRQLAMYRRTEQKFNCVVLFRMCNATAIMWQLWRGRSDTAKIKLAYGVVAAYSITIADDECFSQLLLQRLPRFAHFDD